MYSLLERVSQQHAGADPDRDVEQIKGGRGQIGYVDIYYSTKDDRCRPAIDPVIYHEYAYTPDPYSSEIVLLLYCMYMTLCACMTLYEEPLSNLYKFLDQYAP